MRRTIARGSGDPEIVPKAPYAPLTGSLCQLTRQNKFMSPSPEVSHPAHQSVLMSRFLEDTLIVVGHGSTLNADSSRPTHLQAQTLKKCGLFGQVLTCFWKEQPVISAVLRSALGRRVFVVPLFISEGYFTEQVIPRELGLTFDSMSPALRVQSRGEKPIFYCGPVGTHSSMTSVILSRALEVVAKSPTTPPALAPAPADCSLFIAGHGTSLNDRSRQAIEAQVERIGARKIYRDVHGIFMEEEPKIAKAYALAKTDNLVIVPFFISDGLHSYEDIPVMLGASINEVRSRMLAGQSTWPNPTRLQGKRVWYSRSIGDEPLLTSVILDRVVEAADSSPSSEISS